VMSGGGGGGATARRWRHAVAASLDRWATRALSYRAGCRRGTPWPVCEVHAQTRRRLAGQVPCCACARARVCPSCPRNPCLCRAEIRDRSTRERWKTSKAARSKEMQGRGPCCVVVLGCVRVCARVREREPRLLRGKATCPLLLPSSIPRAPTLPKSRKPQSHVLASGSESPS